MEVDQDAFQDLQARDVGLGQEDTSGYITGNDDNQPDSADVLEQPQGVPEEIAAQDQPEESFGPPGAGDSQVGLGEATGTERFDEDPRGGGLGGATEVEEIGNADMRSQEAVYHQYSEHREKESDR